jgi:hypothetical protein
LAATLRPGDVLLVESQTRVSVAIKYLTQSTWSHAALYVGECGRSFSPHGFVEADIVAGVRIVGLSEFTGLHSRICRPVGLTDEDRKCLIATALASVGQQYDLRNVTDLMRYLIEDRNFNATLEMYLSSVPVRVNREFCVQGS